MRDLETFKTLADMTAEERADCVGMWCDVARGARAVIVNAKEQDYCWVIHPEDGGNVATCRNKMINPRPDLPRVWMTDGQPVPMKKELGFCGTAGLETTVHKYSSGTVYVSDDTPRGEVYRWVGEWEQDNE